MSKGTNRWMCGPVALALLIGAAMPATAEESLGQQEFEIALEDVLMIEDLELETGDLVGIEPREPIRIAALSVRSVRDVGLPAPAGVDRQQSAPTESKTRRTGRWLKKHWWVPTLVGVAVGVALLEPFDDDDDERRRAQMNP